jgi:hypothetical protein
VIGPRILHLLSQFDEVLSHLHPKFHRAFGYRLFFRFPPVIAVFLSGFGPTDALLILVPGPSQFDAVFAHGFSIRRTERPPGNLIDNGDRNPHLREVRLGLIPRRIQFFEERKGHGKEDAARTQLGRSSNCPSG